VISRRLKWDNVPERRVMGLKRQQRHDQDDHKDDKGEAEAIVFE
jgi:hypothetical protein